MNDAWLVQRAIMERLAVVVDPETGIDVVRMRLVDDVTVDGDGQVTYTVRPSSALCPLAVPLALAIHGAVREVLGVTRQVPTVEGHVHAAELTAMLRGMAEESGREDS